MTFQFLCPQGHLLEGDEAHMGMTTQCPHCGMTFIIPTIEVQQTEPEPEPQIDVYSQPYVPEPAQEPAYEAQEETASSLIDELPQPETPLEAPPDIVHIPCPNGHELETPIEMLGQEVLCPHCGVQYRLRREDSIEYRQERERIEAYHAQLWFKWSIGAAVVVGIVLLAMMVYVMTQS